MIMHWTTDRYLASADVSKQGAMHKTVCNGDACQSDSDCWRGCRDLMHDFEAGSSPTLATPPSWMTMPPRKPSVKDSTSMSALSDSTTTTLSPLVIWSPGLFNQVTTLPSVIVELSAGMKISLIAASGVPAHRLAGCRKAHGRACSLAICVLHTAPRHDPAIWAPPQAARHPICMYAMVSAAAVRWRGCNCCPP